MKRAFCTLLILISITISLTYIFYEPPSGVKQVVVDWENKSIVIPDSQYVCQGSESKLLSSLPSYRLYVVIDTLGCTACSMQIDEWKLFLDESMERKSQHFLLIFVTNTRNATKVKSILMSHGLPGSMVMEAPCDFYATNNISKEWQYRTFLTDRVNKVLLLGSPLYSEGLRELYLELLCSSKS